MRHSRLRFRSGYGRLPSALALALVLLVAFGGIAAAQQTKTLYWQRYDVDLDVQKSGDVRVTETQELVFTNGTFRFGRPRNPD